MVQTTLQYLARHKLYETEKPYSATFEVEEHDDVKRTNYVLSPCPVSVIPVQPSDNFDLDTHGFCIIKAKTKLQVEDALNKPDFVEQTYLDEIEAILHKNFPEYSRLEGMEFVVRSHESRVVTPAKETHRSESATINFHQTLWRLSPTSNLHLYYIAIIQPMVQYCSSGHHFRARRITSWMPNLTSLSQSHIQ